MIGGVGLTMAAVSARDNDAIKPDTTLHTSTPLPVAGLSLRRKSFLFVMKCQWRSPWRFKFEIAAFRSLLLSLMSGNVEWEGRAIEFFSVCNYVDRERRFYYCRCAVYRFARSEVMSYLVIMQICRLWKSLKLYFSDKFTADLNCIQKLSG